MNNKHYAVVIGLNNYSTDIGQLNGAVNDALAFKEWLLRKDDRGGRLHKENVFSLIDGESEEYDFQAITDTLSEVIGLTPLIEGEEELRDRLYIYMAGHGITLDEDSLVSSDSTALLSLQCKKQNLSRHIAEYTIRTMSSKLGWYKEVVIIMDCCRNKTGKSGLCAFWNDRRKNHLLDAIGSPNFYMLYSTRPLFKAREIKDSEGKYYGVFTESLIRNLQGAVDTNNHITLDSLKNIIFNDFNEHSSFNRFPVPQIMGDSEPLVFSVQGDVLKSTIVLHFDDFAGTNSKIRVTAPNDKEANVDISTEQSPLNIDGLSPGKYTIRVFSGSDEPSFTLSTNLTSGETRELVLSMEGIHA